MPSRTAIEQRTHVDAVGYTFILPPLSRRISDTSDRWVEYDDCIKPP